MTNAHPIFPEVLFSPNNSQQPKVFFYKGLKQSAIKTAADEFNNHQTRLSVVSSILASGPWDLVYFNDLR